MCVSLTEIIFIIISNTMMSKYFQTKHFHYYEKFQLLRKFAKCENEKIIRQKCFKCIDDKLIDFRMHKAYLTSVVSIQKEIFFLPRRDFERINFLLTSQITADCE